MSPWERLNAELHDRHKSWSGLAVALDLTKQTVGHWKKRGIPAKYYRQAADFVGKNTDWLEYGVKVEGASWPFTTVTPDQYFALPKQNQDAVESVAFGLVNARASPETKQILPAQLLAAANGGSA